MVKNKVSDRSLPYLFIMHNFIITMNMVSDRLEFDFKLKFSFSQT